MGPTVLSEEQTTAWKSLLRAHANVVNAVDRELASEHKLGLADFDVLSQLAMSNDRSLRMTELAKLVLLSPSGLTRRLDGLVKQGYVERRPCPSDGRGLLAFITDAGAQKLRDMQPTHSQGVHTHFVSAVDDQKLIQLSTLLASLADSSQQLQHSQAG